MTTIRTGRVCAALFTTALVAAGCGTGDDAPQQTGEAADHPASVSITSPGRLSFDESPVHVTMQAAAFEIAEAGDVVAGSGHFHLMVDVPCVAPGRTIPADADHLHFGDAAAETELDLEPGEHTLCLQAGDGEHTALALTDEVTFTVIAPGEAPPDGIAPPEGDEADAGDVGDGGTGAA